MSYAIPDFQRAVASVTGTSSPYPIRRIYLVGRNYAEHAREMGHDPNREKPFFFQKPPDSALPYGSKSSGKLKFPYPPLSSNVHHEIELVVALGSGGANIEEGDALNHVYGYAVGIDITRRDLQQEMKQKGRPWEAGKSFDYSAPMSDITPAASIGHPSAGRIWLTVNDELRQNGDLNQLIWSVPEIITELSKLFELAAGDLIFTGTPAGVGPIEKGDRLFGAVEGVSSIEIEVV